MSFFIHLDYTELLLSIMIITFCKQPCGPYSETIVIRMGETVMLLKIYQA